MWSFEMRKAVGRVAIAAVFAAFAAFGRDASLETAPYMDASLSIDARLDDLVSRMTLEEKVAVLSTMKGFNAYEIRDGEVYPSKELMQNSPGVGSSAFSAPTGIRDATGATA
jgi:beta-glucosidase